MRYSSVLASCWLRLSLQCIWEDDALVMGKATLEIRDFMAALGLSVNQESNIPDDHISCVLELTTLLLANIRQTSQYRTTLTQYINNYLTSGCHYISKK
ncbi:dehydrogenase [Salmonella enterica subsp. enterica]|uniref:Dehydrogenase n=1 Tax=Salmonella enterica I TaxID=59201 RepID=A0A3S4F9R5_SALET|nr:dehydrogenase [Salmonella enterica subsp. enterica]